MKHKKIIIPVCVSGVIAAVALFICMPKSVMGRR